ncbi:MAG: hypothetical protein S4CHLAM6_16140 [Chlamydiae bacterium]|nr:hypothetical protein [Chlamydiota bacterium]
MIKDIHFSNPSASYLLILAFGIVLVFAYSLSQRKKSLKDFADSDSLSSLLFLEKRTFFRYIMLACVWFLSTIALMQPEKIQSKNYLADHQKELIDEKIVDNTDLEKILVKRRACDIIFLLDASASMQVKDTRQLNSRLDYAKEIVDEMISGMDGQNVVLYTFTSALTPVVPPTLDYFFTRLMLKDIHVNYGDIAGTDLFEAIDQISKRHFLSSPKKQKVLVLLTDGGDTYLDSLEKSERAKQLQVMLDKVKQYKDQNVRVYTIGLGGREGSVIPDIKYNGQPVTSSLDSDLLAQLSKEGRGQYYFANDYSAVTLSDSILSVVQAENTFVEEEQIPQKKIQRSTLETSPSTVVKKKLFQLPLGLALLLLGFELTLPLWPVRSKVDYD